jgi:hypothetical protein
MRHVMAALVAVALGMTTTPALAADPPPGATVALRVAPPPPTYAGQAAVLSLTLTADGQPVPDEPVNVERQQAGAWVPVATPTTGADGTASAPVTLAKLPADNAVRLTYRDDDGAQLAQQSLTLPLRQRAGRVAVSGPGAVVDERTSPVNLTWRADDGAGVAGPVTLQVAERTVVKRKVVKPKAGKRRTKQVVQWRWRTAAVVTTGADGRATFTATPRVDTRWRAVATSLPWVTGGVSAVYSLDNRPPGSPVRLPRKAPKPKRKLPVQPHAVGAGPNPVVTAIPDAVWRSMVGRTWHAGCPVGRNGLRLLQVNYWDYTGYRRRGQIVIASSVAGQVAAAFADLYAHRIPIRSLVREDRFGWSSRLHGANDYQSMEAGNSSGFNCRGVVGNPRVRSPHSYGTAIDINTWENPYRSARGTVPNRWWQRRSHPRVAWRSASHVVVRIMARHGLRWTYGLGDTQHFDAVPSGASRPVLVECGLPVCD